MKGQYMLHYDKLADPYNVYFATSQDGSERQCDEFFLAKINGVERRVNLHDYKTMYSHPMLYDIVLYKYLHCRTPQEIGSALSAVWSNCGVDVKEIRALEIGAGSGAFGEELRNGVGVEYIVGLDIIDKARLAAERDRPKIYDSYVVADLTDLTPPKRTQLAAENFNCVAVASATGWGNHIPVEGFKNAFAILQVNGWFIFHVKPNDPDPECVALCEWIVELEARQQLDVYYRESHYHRSTSCNEKIYYDVIIGKKC